MKIAICDDDAAICLQVERWLRKISVCSDALCTTFVDGSLLLQQVNAGEHYDIILLDVEMRQMDGVKTAREIRKIDKDCLFLFISGFTQYVSDAFEVQAFQFLIKPLTFEKLEKEMQRACRHYEKKHFQYTITYRGETHVLKTNDIYVIETYRRRLRLSTQSQTYEYIGKLKDVEQLLQPYGFLRCHQGYLLNMYHIRAYTQDSFRLDNNVCVPIGRQLRKTAFAQFNYFLSGSLIKE